MHEVGSRHQLDLESHLGTALDQEWMDGWLAVGRCVRHFQTK
jgi:hypothetical protein